MQIEKGCVVRSISGRDADRFYVVMELQDDCALICDGKVRRLVRPKRKNLRHLRPTKTLLALEDLTTNNQLRRALRAYNNPEEAGPSTKGR